MNYSGEMCIVPEYDGSLWVDLDCICEINKLQVAKHMPMYVPAMNKAPDPCNAQG